MSNQKTTGSGIEVGGGPAQELKGTMKLSRSMSMTQRKRTREKPKEEAPPPPPPQQASEMIYSVATETEVACPKCAVVLEIAPEYYGIAAECPECTCEFIIKPPGTPPYQKPVAATSSPIRTGRRIGNAGLRYRNYGERNYCL